jgi:3-phenylpropionate/trans-cinnamate dioxygenase ferredoxin subunit
LQELNELHQLKTNWIKVADSVAELSFGENKITEVVADGKTICIAQNNDELFAFAHKCPHAGGYFVQGYMDALGNVVCPIHRYKFCLRNGRNVSGEGYYLKHWPVEAREDGVYVGLEARSLFGLL